MSSTQSKRQDHRHSNSFTDGAVLAVVAVNRELMRDPRYLALMRNPGWQEVAKKFGAAKARIDERSRAKEQQGSEAAE